MFLMILIFSIVSNLEEDEEANFNFFNERNKQFLFNICNLISKKNVLIELKYFIEKISLSSQAQAHTHRAKRASINRIPIEAMTAATSSFILANR